MASTPRSATAALFMRRCRQPATRSASHYAPSSFNKKYNSPITSPSPVNPYAGRTSTPLPKSPSSSDPTSPYVETVPSFLSSPRPRRPSWAKTPANSTQVPAASSRTSLANYLRRKVGLAIPTTGATIREPFNVWNNPYKAHKRWPPDILRLNPKQQLHFEKTFRRRSALKWERPVFKRWLKLIQNSMIAFVVFYAVFLFDDEEGGTLFDGLRAWIYEIFRDSDLLPGALRNDADRKVQQYETQWQKMKDSFFEITPVEGLQIGPAPDPEYARLPMAARARYEEEKRKREAAEGR